MREDGTVLLAQRPGDKIYSGYWEFPGGKVEPSEPVLSALRREVREELGVDVIEAWPWIVRQFTYPHAVVRLNFFRVTGWTGELSPVEGQQLSWQDPARVEVSPMLPANGPVLKALTLPSEYAITQAEELGVPEFLRRLELRLKGGLRLIQVREEGMGAAALQEFLVQVLKASRSYGAKVLVNSNVELAIGAGADGVHLKSGQMRILDHRPPLEWCGASCHSAEDVRAAEHLGVDFAVLGPVQQTLSHPGTQALGWDAFGNVAKGSSIPVFAIGGMEFSDRSTCVQQGGHGIAMLRGSWRV